MIELSCPWCEATFAAVWRDQEVAQSCPECLTCWTYEAVAEDELAAAA